MQSNGKKVHISQKTTHQLTVPEQGIFQTAPQWTRATTQWTNHGLKHQFVNMRVTSHAPLTVIVEGTERTEIGITVTETTRAGDSGELSLRWHCVSYHWNHKTRHEWNGTKRYWKDDTSSYWIREKMTEIASHFIYNMRECLVLLCTIENRNVALYVHRDKLSLSDSLCIAAVTSVFWYVIGDALIKRLTQREWFQNFQVAMSGSWCCSLWTRRWLSK